MAKARIRGIYSTALTKLLLEHGFNIIQPSTTMEERFDLEEDIGSPDLDIYDRPDRQGIRVIGRAEAFNAFTSLLKDHLDDVILREWPVTINGIYKGSIKHIDRRRSSILLNIGPAVGRLRLEEVPDLKLKEAVVQVKRTRVGAEVPLLTTKIRIPGKYAVLIQGEQVKISRKIRGSSTRARLYRLGERLAPPD